MYRHYLSDTVTRIADSVDESATPRRRAVERARRGSGDMQGEVVQMNGSQPLSGGTNYLKHNTSSICTKLLPSISRRLLPSYCFCVWIHFVPVPAIKIVSPAVAGRGTTDTTDTTARAAAERDLISRVDNALLVKTIWGRLALQCMQGTAPSTPLQLKRLADSPRCFSTHAPCRSVLEAPRRSRTRKTSSRPQGSLRSHSH